MIKICHIYILVFLASCSSQQPNPERRHYPSKPVTLQLNAPDSIKLLFQKQAVQHKFTVVSIDEAANLLKEEMFRNVDNLQVGKDQNTLARQLASSMKTAYYAIGALVQTAGDENGRFKIDHIRWRVAPVPMTRVDTSTQVFSPLKTQNSTNEKIIVEFFEYILRAEIFK
jgi:hypothetical protein